MKVRKLKKQETRALMPIRGNGFPGVLAVGTTAVVTAVMMILAATPGLAETVEGWGDAELIEAEDGSALLAQVAMDGDGNAIAVWQQRYGAEYNLWSNRYVVGVGWGDAELVETNDGSAWYPQVVIDGDGNTIVIWEQHDGTQQSIWSNRYVVGVGWGVAELIEINDGIAYAPQVAMDGDGNAVAIWWHEDGTQQSIWSNRYVVGAGWGVAELVETNDGSAYNPQVAMGGNGNAVAVWEQRDGTQQSIWSNRYVVGVGWGHAEPIETDDEYTSNPQVAMDRDGNAIAVWEQSSDTWSSRYVVGVGWGVAELIETEDGFTWSPQVTVDGVGNAVAVWCQYDGTRHNIWSNRYIVGAGWGDAELVEADDESAECPQVAMDGDGNAIVVWRQSSDIWSNRYVVGVGWCVAELVETGDGRANLPQVAMDDEGNAIAVWHQYDGISDSIFSNRYVNLVDHYQHRHCTGSPDVGAATL